MSSFIDCFYCLILLEVFYYCFLEVFLRFYEYVCIMKAHCVYMFAHIVGGQKSMSKGCPELPDVGVQNQTEVLWKSRKLWMWPKRK